MTDKPDMMFTIHEENGMYYFEVGRDKDDLGCYELRYYEETDDVWKMEDNLIFDPDMAKQLYEALGRLLEYYGDGTESAQGDPKSQ